MRAPFQLAVFTRPEDTDNVPLHPYADIRVNILKLAHDFRFNVESEEDGLGQELCQCFRLADGRPFALNFLVHSPWQDGNRTSIHLRYNTATQEKDLDDVLAALGLGRDALIDEPHGPAPA